jgi:hypothetical protein
LLCLLFCCSCSERTRLDQTQSDEDWVIGPETSVVIDVGAGGQVSDLVSGGVFVFPEGGSGILETAEITGGPTAPYDGDGVYIAYDTDEPITLRLPKNSGDEIMVLGWGTPSGSLDLPEDGECWISLPRVDLGDVYEFTIIPPFDLGDKRSSRRGYTHHHIARLSASSPTATRLAAIRTQTAVDVTTYKNMLPEPLRSTISARISANPLTYYADQNYYIGFTRRFLIGNSTTPMIGLIETATANDISHEVGHYMHHMLVGDASYLNIEDSVPDNHGLGDIIGNRRCIAEDVAYFSQFLLTSSVGAADPTEPSQLYRRIYPEAVDAPSAEGMGLCLLACLMNTDLTIGDLNNGTDRRAVPTIGLSAGDVLSLISAGATNINQLRATIDTYLTGISKADRLPVLLERIGWRHQAKMRLVDTNGDPIKNTFVRKFAKVGSDEFAPFTSTTLTDDEGKISVTNVFPGKTTLRMELLGDSLDVVIDVDPALPTNQIVDLGDVEVGVPLALERAQHARVTVTLFTDISSPWPWVPAWTTHKHYFSIEGEVTGDRFVGSIINRHMADESEWYETSSLEANIDPETGKVTSLLLATSQSAPSHTDWYHNVTVTAGNLEMSSYSMGETSVYYDARVEGPAVCGAISSFTYAHFETNWGENLLQSYACESPAGGTALVRLELSSEPIPYE